MARKKKDPDYQLNIFHHYDEKTKQNVVVFLVQTTKIFVIFQYEILLEDAVHPKDIQLRITGLHVPELLIPQTGPARGRRDYTDLYGSYKLFITKQDKTVNEFLIEITQFDVRIKKRPTDAFIIVSADPVDLR
jgi:hypothetical protein